jgi:hypothetical protein
MFWRRFGHNYLLKCLYQARKVLWISIVPLSIIFLYWILNCYDSFLFLVFSDSMLSMSAVKIVEQELLTLLEHLSSSSVFSAVRVTRFLVLYVCFVDRCLSFCTFSFGHCVVCSSSIYGF